MLMTCSLAGCGTAKDNAKASEQQGNTGKDQLSVVTTIFPEYEWARNIIGDKADNIELTMLLDNGVDLHSYQPTTEDILKISTCDMFVYIGGESDVWVKDVLKEAENKDMIVIDLLEVLGDSIKEEEVVEGMEAEEEEEEGEEGEEEEVEYDEHVWLSLKNASAICDVMAEALGQLDPENKDTYMKNKDAYNEELMALDQKYQEVVDAAPIKTLLFGDRFPFRYLTDDYGLDYYAAFVGCSAETEASFETILFLSGKLDELQLSTILTLENSDQKIAETVRDNTTSKDQKILTMDSMQSETLEDVENGVTYLSLMEKNLDVLKEALQ